MSEEKTADSAPAESWHASLDEDFRTGLSHKGWDKLPPEQAAVELTKAWRAAEKMVGLPADQILRAPKDAGDTAALDAIYARLGAPKDATGYDLSPVKFADGKELEPEFADLMKGMAAEFHLPPAHALTMASKLVKFMESAEGDEVASAAAAKTANEAALKANWGANYDVNMFMAKQAIERLGLPLEFGQSLEASVGYPKAMETLRSLAAKLGEAPFVGGGTTASPGTAMSRSEAQARVETLKGDTEWFKRFYAGGASEKREFAELTRIIAGGQ